MHIKYNWILLQSHYSKVWAPNIFSAANFRRRAFSAPRSFGETKNRRLQCSAPADFFRARNVRHRKIGTGSFSRFVRPICFGFFPAEILRSKYIGPKYFGRIIPAGMFRPNYFGRNISAKYFGRNISAEIFRPEYC